MRKQSGFTLIELMVVMAIIAILATAGLSAYTSYIKKARDSARLQIAKQIGVKVESISTITGAPTSAQLTAFLNAEGFAWTLPTMNPIVASISESLDGFFGTTFALPDIDPLKGAPVCLDINDEPRIVCGFSYFRFSDGTYMVGYTVEREESKVNFLSDNVGGTTTQASFIGNSPVITIANPESLPTPTISAALAALGNTITVNSVGFISDRNDHTNGSPSGPSPSTTY